MQSLRRSLIPRPLRAAMKSSLQMKQRPELSVSNIKRLHKVLDQDLSMLGDKLGVHISCENFKDVVKAGILEWHQ